MTMTYEDAEKLAVSAINDTDGRGMIGRSRNHLHQRVARAILNAVRQEGTAERDGGDGVPVHSLSVQATDKPLQAEGAPAAEGADEIELFREFKRAGCKSRADYARTAAKFAALSPPAAEGKEDAYQRAILWAIDRTDHDFAPTAKEQANTVAGLIGALRGDPSPASAYAPDPWTTSGKLQAALSHTPADQFRDAAEMVSPPAPAADPVGDWVMVPRELTEEMRLACWRQQYVFHGATPTEAVTLAERKVEEAGQRANDREGYTAMLAAAPPPPQQPVEISRAEIIEIVGYEFAALVSGNNMPDMSGDPRNRLRDHQRRRFDTSAASVADAILARIGQ